VFQVAFDDSGKSEPPVFVLAGFISRVQNWADFSTKWDTALRASPRITYLKAHEAYQLKGQFEGWDSKDRDRKLEQLVPIIQRHGLNQIRYHLYHSDFNAVFRDTIKNKPKWFTRRWKDVFDPHFLSVVGVMSWLLKVHTERKTREMLEVIFDEGITGDKRMKRGYKIFMDNLPPRNKELLIKECVDCRDDKKFLPLQAADLLAWHTRRHFFEHARGQKHADVTWQKLQTIKPFDITYTRADLRDVLNWAMSGIDLRPFLEGKRLGAS